MYALVIDNTITETTSNLRGKFPNTSFPKTLPDEYKGWLKVQTPALVEGEKLLNDIVLVDGQPTFEIEAVSTEYYLNVLSTARDNKINSGITVSGIFVATRSEDRSLIAGAVSRALLDSDDAITYPYYPAGGGKVLITNAQYKAIGRAIANHVQACLDAEENVTVDINNYTTAEQVINAFDMEYENAYQ